MRLFLRLRGLSHDLRKSDAEIAAHRRGRPRRLECLGQFDEALAEHAVALDLRFTCILRAHIADRGTALARAWQDETAHETGLCIGRGWCQNRRWSGFEPGFAGSEGIDVPLRLDADAALEAIADARSLMDMGVGNAAFGEAHAIAAHEPAEA